MTASHRQTQRIHANSQSDMRRPRRLQRHNTKISNCPEFPVYRKKRARTNENSDEEGRRPVGRVDAHQSEDQWRSLSISP